MRLRFIKILYQANFRDILMFGHVRASIMNANMSVYEAIEDYKRVYQDDSKIGTLYNLYYRMLNKYRDSEIKEADIK